MFSKIQIISRIFLFSSIIKTFVFAVKYPAPCPHQEQTYMSLNIFRHTDILKENAHILTPNIYQLHINLRH